MITRDGFPIVAKSAIVDINWHSPSVDVVDFIGARIAFDNVNQTTVGEVRKERTSLQFNPADPIPWPEYIPEGITSVWVSPEAALRDILGILYESDEHQYRLGIKVRPEEPAE